MNNKRFFICLMLSIAMCAAYAAKKKKPVKLSPDFQEWVSQYVSLELDGEDSALPLSKIQSHYDTLPATEKGKAKLALEKLTEEASKGNDYFAIIAITDLYERLVTDKAQRAPQMCFARGYAFVVEMQDTVMARDAIDDLRLYDGTQTYINVLERKIEKIRRFIRADKGLEGYWVSDLLRQTAGSQGFYFPKYLITAKEENGKSVFTIEKESPFIYLDCITTKGLLGIAEPQVSQMLFAHTSDSVYIAWSSDKLTNYDADLVGLSRELTRQTAALTSASLAQRNKHSFAERLLGNMAVSAAEAGVNALIDSWTTPSKKSYLLEARLKRVNSHEYRGKMKYIQGKKKEGREPEKEVTTEELSLLRWTPESGVIFMTYGGDPVTPFKTSYRTVEQQKKRIQKQEQKNKKNAGKKPLEKVDALLPYWKDIRDDANTAFGQAYLQYKQSKEKWAVITSWNKEQMQKLREYNNSHSYTY